MNYYNPYMSMMPLARTGGGGLLKSIFGKISWSGILTGTGRTLNVINQAIPVVKQVTPMINNTKTMFKVMNEFKKVDTPVSENKSVKLEKSDKVETPSLSNGNTLTFFQ